MTDFGQAVRNVSKSAVLSASGWDTPPADLDNAIDGDLDNPTGVGQTTRSGWGYSGYINIEMPAAGRYLVMCKIKFWSGFGSCSLYTQSGHGGYFDNNDIIMSFANTTERGAADSLVAFISSANFKLAFSDGVGQEVNMQIYDISIWELC